MRTDSERTSGSGSSKFSLLERAVGIADASGDLKPALDDVIASLELSEEGRDIPYFLFASALAKRSTSDLSSTANVYLRSYDVPHIHLFQTLAKQLPVVSMASVMANELITRAMEGLDDIVLMDIGIGTGRQEIDLLRRMQVKRLQPKRLRIVGVDLSDQCLAEAESAIRAAAIECGIANVEFTSILRVAEELTEDDLRSAVPQGAALIVNSSFALHHVRSVDASIDARDRLFRRIRRLRPVAVVLSEPNANFNTPELDLRFRESWRLFNGVFDLIDRLPISVHDKNGLKVCFFGREIEDVLGTGEGARCERYETGQRWAKRLRESGFDLPQLPDEFLASMPHELVQFQSYPGYVGLDYEKNTLVSMLYAQSSDAPESSVMRSAPAPAPGDDLKPRVIDYVAGKASTAVLLDLDDFDLVLYLRLLHAVASSKEGVLQEAEEMFIVEQARILDVDPRLVWGGPPVDIANLDLTTISKATRRLVLSDCILLAYVDGDFQQPERDTIAKLAKQLRIAESDIAIMEARAKKFLPSVVDDAPAWLKTCWIIQAKSHDNI